METATIMTDAELSLAVAKVIYPKAGWKLVFTQDSMDGNGESLAYNSNGVRFDYRTDNALGKMAVWICKFVNKPTFDKFVRSPGVIIRPPADYWIERFLRDICSDNPHRALAELVLEIGT